MNDVRIYIKRKGMIYLNRMKAQVARIQFVALVMLMLVFVSCVPLKQYTEAKSNAERYRKDNQELKEQNQSLLVKSNEFEAQYDRARLKIIQLEQEIDRLKKAGHDMAYQQERLTRINQELEQQIKALKDGSSDEITKLLSELQALQISLQEREDRVRAAEVQLKAQQDKLSQAEKEVESQKTQLNDAQRALSQQQAKLMELQGALDKQKEAVESLRQKLLTALKGYSEQGLSIYEKNGKVYVSMDEKLLFQSGSYTLGANGRAALNQVGEVLAANPDINIMVEGHTDDVPLAGTGILKDNWDLSVMRATAVTKIILGNPKIDPKRITAAGRSEYIPLDALKTTDARQKNRRTEIILTPDLSQVFNILQSN
jgi:chemotaxis protein MotB